MSLPNTQPAAQPRPPFHLDLDDLPTPAWVSHPDGCPAHFNRAFVEFVGLPLTVLLGEGRREVVHPEDLPAVLAQWDECRRSGRPFAAEYRVRRADGVYRWHSARAAAVRGPDGTVSRWVGTCTDVDDEARGREARAQLSAVVESSGDAISSCALDGTVLTWNPAAERLFGYPAADIVGRSVYLLSPAEALADARAAVARVARGEPVPTYETFRLTRGGVPVPVAVTPSAVRGPSGEVTGFAAVYRDITAQRAAAASVSEARAAAERGLAQLRAVVSSMAEGLIVADGDGNLLEWNPAALRLHGYESLDDVRRHLSSFAATFALARPDGTPVPYADWPLARLLRGESVVDREFHLRRLDTGQEWDVSYTGALVRGPAGRVELAFLTLRDVTDRRRLEAELRQSQKMDAVGRLAGGVAHDFNNLLTVINGYGELLQNALPAADPHRALVQEMTKAGVRAAGLTRQLLAFSRQTVVAPTVLDLNAVVADLEKMLGRVIGEDVALKISLPRSLGSVRADPGQMEQVLVNLCVNARDAMPRGGTLTIGTRDVFLDDGYARRHPDVRPGRYVLLTVTDTGVGMTPDVRARIFEPFFTTKGPGQGTGLGLSTVYGIVTQAGGHVDVESEPGEGTTFRVYLPRALVPARPGASAHDAPPPAGTEAVLLVEDEPAVRALVRRVLQGCGYTTLEARDGEEAVRVCAGHAGPIHLLVTDVVMPGAGGRVLAERLRGLRPDLRVLFVSGYTDDAVVRHGVRHAEVNFLQKPFTPAALATKVREVLDGVA